MPVCRFRKNQHTQAKDGTPLLYFGCGRKAALCQVFGIATSTGYWWIRTWNRQGYEGIREEGKRTGCPPKLDDWDIAYLRTLLVERPYWTTAEVREII